jgi:cyanate lyase
MRKEPMTKSEMTSAILEAKSRLGLSWTDIAKAAGLSSVFLTSACLGMNSLSQDAADKLCATLDLPRDTVGAALREFPHKTWDDTIPTDPVIYRFYEMIHVYGETMKAIIHEKFGDGIMSAIDFDMFIDRVGDPKGDRVKITMTGKFLPYRSW